MLGDWRVEGNRLTLISIVTLVSRAYGLARHEPFVISM